MRLVLAVTTLLAVTALPAAADTDSQWWHLVTAMGRLQPRVRWYAEGQYRFSAVDHRDTDRTLLRGALGWQTSRTWSFWQGFAWTPSYQPRFRNETRSFQQFLYEDGKSGFRVVSRTRLEQRDIAATTGTSHRFRSMLRVVRPLDRTGVWQAAASDEAFWNLNSVGGGPQAGFDRNRLFLGANRRIGRGVRLEAGWLHEEAPRRGGGSRRIDSLVTWLHYDL